MNKSKRTPESEIVKLAKSGALAMVGKRAIKESHRLGLSVTILEGDTIFSLHPDGSRTLIKKISKSKRNYSTRKIFIK